MKKGIEQESRQASKHKEKRKRRTHHSGAGGTAARRRGRITIALALRAGRNGGEEKRRKCSFSFSLQDGAKRHHISFVVTAFCFSFSFRPKKCRERRRW